MATPEFYPRELWQHSLVYNSFVKLFIADIHALRYIPTEGPALLPFAPNLLDTVDSVRFWLNYPIRWIQVVGIIVALTQKEKADIILCFSFQKVWLTEVDDASGETIELVVQQQEHRAMMPDRDDEEFQARLWKRRRKAGRIEVGDLIKVKGELLEKWKVRRLNVMKLGTVPRGSEVIEDIVTNQNVETKAWEERVEFKTNVLSKPWKLPSAVLSKHHKHGTDLDKMNQNVEKPKVKPIDFHTLSTSAHSIRNLKLLILTYIISRRQFTSSDLLAEENIHYATSCVATQNLKAEPTEKELTATLLSALNLLLNDGNIIIPTTKPQHEDADIQVQSIATNKSTFIVVGKWNLGSTIKSAAKKDAKIVVRELWKKIVSWGKGWEGTTKGVIAGVVEEVLTGIEGEEWVEAKPGVWTRLDVE